jgi:hypothetical protein
MPSTAPSDWNPYVVAQGDTLTSLAAQSPVPRDVIWTNPKNADLAKQRTNPDVLLAGDLIYLPPPHDQKPTSLQIGSLNSFVSPVEYMPIQVQAEEFAGASYTAVADGQTLEPGSVKADGQLSLSVPVDTQIVDVMFASPGGAVQLLVGHLDPVDSSSGRRQRLQNLGWVVPEPGYSDAASSYSGAQDNDGAVDDSGGDDDASDHSDDEEDDGDSSPDEESAGTADTGDGGDDSASSDGASEDADPDYGGPVNLGADDDGSNDHGLRRALALYQQANTLAPTGEPDDATLAQLEKDHGL